MNRGRSYEERNSNQAKHTDNPGIRFSLKDVSAADVETLRRENRKLTEALDAAKAQLKLTKGKRQIKPSAFAAYAGPHGGFTYANVHALYCDAAAFQSNQHRSPYCTEARHLFAS